MFEELNVVFQNENESLVRIVVASVVIFVLIVFVKVLTSKTVRRITFKLLHHSKIQKYKSIPGPTPYFPLGSIKELAGSAPWIKATQMKEKFNSGITLLWAAGSPVFLLNDPELIEEVFQKDVVTYDKPNDTLSKVLDPTNIFTPNGETYLAKKKNDAFYLMHHGDQWIPAQVPAIRKVTLEHLAKISTLSEKGPVKFLSLIEFMMLDIFSHNLVGQSLGDEAYNDFHYLALFTTNRMKSPLKTKLPILSPKFHSTRNRLNDVIKKPIDYAYRNPDPSKPDLVNFVIKHRPQIPFVPGEVTNIFFGGALSTASALLSCLHCLSHAPKELERLRRELQVNLNGGLNYDFEDLESCTYLDCVLRESVRLHPPVLLTGRIANFDVSLGGADIKKGTKLIISTWFAHHNPDFWKDPYTFNPDRWISSHFRQQLKWDTKNFCPFGQGNRACSGNLYALVVLKAALAAFVQFSEFFTDKTSWIDDFFFGTNMPFKLRGRLQFRKQLIQEVSADSRGVLPSAVENQQLEGKYTFVVKTADQKFAGTDSTVSVQLIGEHGTSDFKVLDNLHKNDFEQGATDHFEVQFDRDYGRIGAVKFTLKGEGVNAGWKAESIQITSGKTGHTYSFPAYGWVSSTGRVFFEGQAFLPQTTPDYVKEYRQNQLQNRREVYDFALYDDLGTEQLPRPTLHRYPRRLNHEDADIPDDEKFTITKTKDFFSNVMKGLVGKTGVKVIHLLHDLQWKSLHDYDKVFKAAGHDLPAVASRWQADSEFGSQRWSGLNPCVISLVTEDSLVKEMGLTDKHVKDFLHGDTIAHAISKKRLFVLNYRAMAPLMEKLNVDGHYCTAPICFFYTNNAAKELRPVAIQLVPNGDIYTPNETKWSWLIARMYVAEVDTGFHQLYSHWVRTHACSEPYVVAWHRNISEMHPLYKLLRPHFHYTIAINAKARARLVQAGGHIENAFFTGQFSMETSQDFYDLFWDFRKQALPVDLEERGVASKEVVAEYPYRDDGLDIWYCIEKYLRNVVTIYYKSDSDVTGDEELTNWYHEIRTKGHPVKADTFIPLNGIESLVRVLTTMVWIVSGHHAAVNFSQFSYSSYGPNHPVSLTQLPPARTSELTEADFMQRLPGYQVAALVISVTNTLSAFAPPGEEEYLGAPHQQLFTDVLALKALDDFKSDLVRVEQVITERNSKRAVTYPFLLPSHIPSSIAI